MNKSIQFALNGVEVAAECRPDTTVLEWLRSDAELRGTKEGCAEGDCGACSILLKKAGRNSFLATNSCILLMGQIEGASVMTVEGLAASQPSGHPVQVEIATNGSSQCGFCTPGIVCALAGLLEGNTDPEDKDIHDALAGNLCRCTGYRPIVDAAKSAAATMQGNLPDAAPKVAKSLVSGGGSEFHLPQSLDDLLALVKQHPHAVLLGGGTDISLAVAHARERWETAIVLGQVAELCTITDHEDAVEFGGAVTWEQTLPYLEQYWPSFATLVRRFGSTQIRSMGTVAGNLATASPIGDGAPALFVLDASVSIVGEDGERRIPIEEFFLDYRKSALKAGELIKTIHIPKPADDQSMRVYKVSKRYDQDISTVCGAFSISLKEGRVSKCRIAFGGVAATPVRCRGAEDALINKSLDEGTVQGVKHAIAEQLSPLSDLRGSADYRSHIAAALVDRLIADLEGQVVEVMAL